MKREIQKRYARAFRLFCFRGAVEPEPWRGRLTPQQQKIYNLIQAGWKPPSIAERTGISLAGVWDGVSKIRGHGYEI